MQYVYDIMRKSALYLQHLPHIPVSFTLRPDPVASFDLLHHLGSYITRNKGMTIFQMSLLTALSCYAATRNSSSYGSVLKTCCF